MANYDNYVIQGNTLDVIAEGVKTLSDMDTSAKISPAEMTSKLAQANADVETQADLLAQIQTALEGKAAGSGSEIIAEIASLIDQSGVLDSTDGTATEKVEQLIQGMSLLLTSKALSFSGNKTIECIDFYINHNLSNIDSLFRDTSNLKYLKGINTSKCTKVKWAFMWSGIEEIQEPFDLSNVTETEQYQNALIIGCPQLKEIRFKRETIKVNFPVTQSNLLSTESIQSIIDGLAIVETAQTLTLHADVKAKLTEEQLATITSKNWNLA